MKTRKTKFLMAGALAAVIVLGGGAGYLVHTSSTNASQLDEKDAEQTVKNYFAALETKNAEDAVKYSIDTRYGPEQEGSRKSDYRELMASNTSLLKNIDKIVKIDEKTFTATLDVYTNDNGNITLDFPVTLTEDGSWKIVIGQSIPAQ
ncbi:DUF4878 domain-containing protein [Paenibacillus rhizovicinus]|uniref:DUF4878 domain-containing protein n=1 Tax=Paenibacillus rhizovicinus TaxID=2704463 RepID=A0A6C0P376_9BACL|nr:DUF4878 domain-containing protein [Paenibacillus rhizovicinus]QHW33020.1 DUF4878 domain-containing protein [Paenibacillus rhizovicinus]